MALPDWLARMNRVFTNRLTSPLARRLPWFCVLEHVGRRSGRVRRTPLNVFHRGGGRWVFALTYGPDAGWVRNVLAAGECRILTRGRWVSLVRPRRYLDPSRRSVPLLVRWALAVIRVDWFLEMQEA